MLCLIRIHVGLTCKFIIRALHSCCASVCTLSYTQNLGDVVKLAQLSDEDFRRAALDAGIEQHRLGKVLGFAKALLQHRAHP